MSHSLNENGSLSSATALKNISKSYIDCHASLPRLLSLLSNSPDSSVRSHQRGTEQFLEIFGRLRTWAEETRAVIPASSRGSLDFALRKDQMMKSTVASILAKIQHQVEHAAYTLHTASDGNENDSGIDPAESLDSDESIATSDGYEDENGHSKDAMKNMRQLLLIARHINEDIDSLFQISVLISRPGFVRRYIHSTQESEWDPRVMHFLEFDVSHVEAKILDWGRIQDSGEDEHTATPEIIDSRSTLHGFSDTLKELALRLARANTKRREQLLYWVKHPDSSSIPTKASKSSNTAEAISPSVDAKPESNSNNPSNEGEVTPLAPVKVKSEGGRSITTTQTFSTAFVTDLFGTQTVAGPERTIYAESTVGNKRSNRVPDVPPGAKNDETFECPYCHLTLQSKQMEDRTEWKRHIFRDLRPYVCTFDDCQTPDKQYQSRHDWVYHETQMHRRQWVCEKHHTSFATKQGFINHIIESHQGSVTQEQLPVLTEMSERAMDHMQIVSCPLCPDERQLQILHSHLGEHLEAIALFVLPNLEAEETSGNDGDDSDKAVGENARSP
ncbi:hypothetical protein BDV96DRAFT_653819 [Lophiotrema nucula]|uniref:Oxidoreductase acuF-like C2H2 type zinc-finger domain-containing protein n=1 Tax=Lophiotrema nucula TaxID=690887 RepID=A0A6A5YMU3_9PLEO|nr:hypothetical protein BDV96DRAFT_653819 [Lophiotrema nucula]